MPSVVKCRRMPIPIRCGAMAICSLSSDPGSLVPGLCGGSTDRPTVSERPQGPWVHPQPQHIVVTSPMRHEILGLLQHCSYTSVNASGVAFAQVRRFCADCLADPVR